MIIQALEDKKLDHEIADYLINYLDLELLKRV